jgi:hypothetical protein
VEATEPAKHYDLTVEGVIQHIGDDCQDRHRLPREFMERLQAYRVAHQQGAVSEILRAAACDLLLHLEAGVAAEEDELALRHIGIELIRAAVLFLSMIDNPERPFSPARFAVHAYEVAFIQVAQHEATMAAHPGEEGR